MKLWAMWYRATQDGMGNGGEFWKNVVHWRREWQTASYSCLENSMNSMKRQNDMTLKDELPRLVGVQYATGDEWRNNSRKNEEMEPKQKQCPVVDVTGDGSKVRCCREQYCIGTWNVRSISQFSHSVIFNSLWPHELQHTRTPCPSPTTGDHPDSCPSRHWCHPTISSSIDPSPPALNLWQHQGLFRVSSSHEVAKVLEFQLQHQSFQWTPRTDLL